MIRIAIDGGDFAPGGIVRSGIHRLVDSFLRNVPNESRLQFNYYYFGKQSGVNDYPTNIHFKNIPNRFFGSIQLPYHVSKDRNDVFLGFSGYLPTFLRLSPIKKIIFLHDLGFYHLPKFYPTASKMKRQTGNALKNSNHIIVFSDYVKKQIRGAFPHIERDKVTRIYPGTDHLQKAVVSSRIIDSDYFLYVGVIKPIKNIEKLLSIFYSFLTRSQKKDYKLILIGAKEAYYYRKLLTLALYNKLKKNLVFLSPIPDSLLLIYYRCAIALLNTSYVEGFCYPIFEGLTLGTPVVVDELPLYKEFKNYFQGLCIGVSNDKIVGHMLKLASSHKKYSAPRIPKNFTWKNFSQKIIQLASSES